MAAMNKQQGALGKYIYFRGQGYLPSDPRAHGDGIRAFLRWTDESGYRSQISLGAKFRGGKRDELLRGLKKGSRVSVKGAIHKVGERYSVGINSGIQLADDDREFGGADAQGAFSLLRDDDHGLPNAMARLFCKDIMVDAELNERLRRLIASASIGDVIRLSGALRIDKGVKMRAEKILFEETIRNKKGRR